MSTGEDEPSSGLNGRLRPRKLIIPSLQSNKSYRKTDVKLAHESKSKRTSTASKVFPNKPDDLTHIADTPAPQILCPYCDRNFFAKQAASKHIRNTHILTPEQDQPINCLFCNHIEDDGNEIIRHMIENHPNQYFACYDCHTRFSSTTELAEHTLNACERQKLPYRNKLRQKTTPKKNIKTKNINGTNEYGSDDKNYTAGNGFNGIVISCELKPSHLNDTTDIEDNITTNLILPSSKSISNTNVIDKNAVIVLDDLQWNKRIPSNFSFHNADADQILSRLGVVHRSPRTGESNRREYFKCIDESTQKFEKCFDTSFYSKVASNVQENLMKFLDGSFNFNPDAENTIKTRKAKNSVAINTVEGFPILLACDQFNRNIFDAYMPRAIAPKHKWKWDNLENEKTLMTPDQIKRDSHTNNCIISLVSSLDIWTQLCMRKKYEEKFNKSPIEKKNEKQSIIGKELKEILESRELPTSSTQIVKYIETPTKVRSTSEFPSSLGLAPTTRNYNLKPAVLSGEWVRPRCYVCCACGVQTRDSRALASHISNHHPNAQIQHYEIVGEVLLKSDILKHLYVPPSQINNRTRPLRGFKECTKCKKSVSLDDLHQHILDCAGDTPTIRRKCRYRAFGMRKKRPRLPDNTIRKKMRKDIRSRHSRKNIRSRQKIRTEVGDAETIRKMLADLPAKRHRVVVNQLNPIMRPRRKLNKQRNKLVIKKRMVDEVKKKALVSNFSHASVLSGVEPKKGSSNHVNRKPIKRTVKRVASKLLRHKDSLTKKVTMTRSRRKGVPRKQASLSSSDTPQPTDAEGGGQNQQRSTENNPDRSNANEGSYSGQERSNGSQGSDNRNNPSGTGGENNNSENPSPPNQHAPLKHSIDRLTANTVTDDDCGFHKFLVIQKHYNDLVRFLPPEERMLFENEAIVIKLDKPPLHFDHQAFYDSQMFQRSKFNKRKGLNDCIAMLKNKLVEPRSGPPMGHFSVQCGTHEPLVPQPPISDRRYSTTDMNIEGIHRSMLMHYRDLDRSLNDTRGSCSTRSRVTRRSCSARDQSVKEKYSDNDINNEYMQWKLYYDSQMYAAQRNSEQYTRHNSSLLRPVLPTEELMMRQAMTGSLLTGNHLINFPNYSYITPLAPQKSPRKSRCDSAKSGSKATKDTFTASDVNSMNMANLQTNPRPRRNCRRKTEPSAAEVFPVRTTVTQNVQTVEGNARGDNLANTKSTTNVYPQRNISEDRANRVMESSVLPNSLHQGQAYQSALLYQNAALMQYPRENNLGSVHYRLHSVEPLNAVPLDLSNKSLNTVEQQRVVRYATKQQCRSTDHDAYETLDLSKRSSDQRAQLKETQINRNDISNIHINYDSHLNNSSGLTPLPSEINTIEKSLTNLSLGHTSALNNKNNYYPVELSNKKTDETNLYEKTQHKNFGEMVTIQDRFHPVMRAEYNNLDRMREDYLPKQGLTDLSSRRHKNNPNISATSEKRGVIGNMPSDLSTNNKETGDRIYLDSEGIREYYQNAVLNNKASSSHNDSEPQLPLNCIDAAKMINIHYSTTISPQANNTKLGTIINYPESTVHRSVIPRDDSQNITTKLNNNCLTTTTSARDGSQNISTSKLKPTTARKCDLTTAVSTKSLCNSDLRNDITNTDIDVPLSSSSNLAPNSQDRNSIEMATTRAAFSHIYEHTQQGFISPNVSPCQKNERSKLVNSNNTNSLHVSHKLPLETTETVVMSESAVSPPLHKLKNNDLKRFHMEETEEITKPQKHIPNTNLKQDNGKSCSETVKSDSITTALDHDIETARKIAMLPKELVDIIDNIPVDHRNQLLSVLPQYVSTSTSPTSLSNIDKNGDNCIHLDSNSHGHINNESENQYKSDSKLDEGNNIVNNISVSQNSQFIDSSPTAVTSSILLTPPTPQLSDCYSKSQETNETTFLKYRRKSLHSNDGQTPIRSVDPDKLITGSNLPLIKRLKLDENYTKDRIIDLTIDEFSSENPDTYYNPDPSIHAIPLPSAIGTNLPKIYSDKTASLRAVRIKTPSERNRAIVPVSTETKVIDDELENRLTNITNPVAIQQTDISSTQNRTVSQNSPISSVLDQSYTEDNLIGDTQERLEKETMIKSELEKKDGQQNKQNLTSSLFKDMNDIENVDGFKQKDNLPEKSFEVINMSTSKKNETESDLRLDTDNSINIVMSEKPVDTPPILKDKALIENEDSEDDVSLAVIVKQRNRDIKLDTKNNNDSCTKKNRKIKKLKVSKQITEEKLSQDKSGVILTDNVMSYTSTDLTKKLSESSAKIKDTELTEDLTNEKGISSKKKIRKGRKVNNSNMDHDKIYHSIAENEINKENNLSPEVVKNMDEDMVKSKSPETDTNRSIVPNKMVTTIDKEISSKNEKVKALELSAPCTTDSAKIQECNRNSETIKTINKKEPETSKLMSCDDKVNLISSDICTNPINQENNSSFLELNKINTIEKPDEAKDLNSTKNADDIKHNMQSNDVLFKNKSDSDNISSEEHEDDQKDETSMTPLRRSRRGKSLFIDNSSIVKNNSLQTENSIEHRTPLTKKQLIFSKLLLDEENHNKLSINRLPEKQTNEITPVNRFKDSYEFTSESEIEKELEFEDTIQNNKRRKSQQFKKKCKKQKPMTNLQPTSESSEVKPPTKSAIPSNTGSPTADDIVSVPHVSSQAADNCLSNKDSGTNNKTAYEINTVSVLPVEDFNKQKVVSTEKRKSSSPDRCDLLSSLKPKKTKLNDEDNDKIDVIHNQDYKIIQNKLNDDNDKIDVIHNQDYKIIQNKLNDDNDKIVVIHNQDYKMIQKEAKHVEDNGGVTAIVVSRNIPCYNKPVPRRARSKSVVVKSCGSELYDPYDINLEDMVEKTEPFVRKEITTKIGFNLFKSSIADKTRKLTKTAPAAIIDISPSECSDITLSTTGKINEVNTAMNVTKDFSVDSDESSKSDVPLKKYVEEKERKLSEESNNINESKGNTSSVEKSDKSGGRSKPRKKNKRVQSINKKVEKALTKEDTEEELRSEQFMESFGFFSERKPRKSNLLATKKISETFHIIGNDSDDNSFGSKEFLPKNGSNETKKEENIKYSSNKKPARRGRKKKSEPPPGPSYCDICKKAFRRSDNYLRHQVSLIHISKISEVELNLKTVQIEEEPNYLIAYKQQLDRLKVLQNKIAKRKKNCLSTADIILPTLEEILADVKRTIREQQLSRRGLSRDQELFIDCCEMLKESHKNDQAPINKRTRNCNSFNCAVTCQEELALLERSISDDRCDIKCDGDVDSITAKNILESEEVRNLENDLIFNLKEANKLKGTMSNVQFKPPEVYTNNEQEIKYDEEPHKIKSKSQVEVKDKMYPDEEIIDMFEDKFDKIKRKCRSQAAAAKQIQTHVDAKPISHKNKKKTEKKKAKKSSKKCQGTVPTKGALKGFDGIKVSILTSDINLSAIVPPIRNSSKKKKKCSRKKRDRKYSNESGKSNNNVHCSKGSIQKKADVYEFIDTEDTELFEFRPSTLMERFKSISNKEAVPSTSKTMDQNDLADVSSESASDGDDFVYMSDDYVCSDEETENSMVSCELGTGLKKSASPLKRKDIMEKNAVMGKIFKHNAVRSERKSPKSRESPKPKANLDQLFDSLLQEEHKPLSPAKDHPQIPLEGEQPSTSRPYSSLSPDSIQSPKYDDFTSKPYDKVMPVSKDISDTTTKSVTYPSTSSKKRKSITPPRKLDLNLIPSTIEYKLLAPMRNDHFKKYQINKDRPSISHLDAYSKKYDNAHSEEADDSSADEDTLHRERYSKHISIEHTHKKKPYFNKKKDEEPENNDISNPLDEVFEDAGVARQRARRKCTVGKQNVLAETWSSESEPDGRPPRPNSAESVIGGARKKRGRKKEMSCSRKVNRSVKKPETESVGRPRSPCYWSEGEEEQEHPQQHGWIVGDSHKKLVTMLAHAKGRKRHDDKRQVLE